MSVATNDPSHFYLIYDKKLKRINNVLNDLGLKNKVEYITRDKDLSHFNYIYISSNISPYYLSSDENLSFISMNNNLQALANRKINSKTHQFYTNSSHSKHVAIYKLKHYDHSFDISFQNSEYLSSPGEFLFNSKDVFTANAILENENSNDFVMVGKKSQLYSKKKIILSSSHNKTNVKIKNIGDVATKIYIGFCPYTRDNKILSAINYPYYSKNEIIKVLSAEKGSTSIIVDNHPHWRQGCYLAQNASEDYSDLPSFDYLSGRILKINSLSDDCSEIIIDKPLEKALSPGLNLRVHGIPGGFLYTNIHTVNPGEEISFSSSIKKDDSSFRFSPDSFPFGVFYVVPLILSYSIKEDCENTILINNYFITH